MRHIALGGAGKRAALLAICVSGAGLAVFVAGRGEAFASTDCASAIDRASVRYESRIHKALADCEVRAATGAGCKTDKRDATLAKARDGLASQLSAACTDEDLAGLGFPAACGDDTGGTFSAADLTDCIASTHRDAIDAAVAMEVPGSSEPLSGNAAGCQKKITRASQSFLKTNLDARQRCVAGGDGAECFEEGPATGNSDADATLEEAGSELTDAVERACADVDLALLGFPADCNDDAAPFEADELAVCLVD